MRSTYSKEDVTILLKDISGMVEPIGTKEREALIQSGIHYCEMLPLEYKPSEKYIEIYNKSLSVFAQATADAVARVAEEIYRKKGNRAVIISLARAGISVGVLIKRYLQNKYNIEIAHYSISIIRDKGIDKNAMNYILQRHAGMDLQFVDGWVGKGAIFHELVNALKDYQNVDTSLAVLADPARITELCGTHDDILIPSSCLNSTISGLISRTFLKKDIIGEKDFHGAAFYPELMAEDRTYEFIHSIEKCFKYDLDRVKGIVDKSGIVEVERLQEIYKINNMNLIKPGIGETTRVLLRRVPWKVLIAEEHRNSVELEHIIQLAKEKEVDIEYCDLNNYKCCGIIRNFTDA